VPLIPIARETWVFFRPRLRFEGWTNTALDLTADDGPLVEGSRVEGSQAPGSPAPPE